MPEDWGFLYVPKPVLPAVWERIWLPEDRVAGRQSVLVTRVDSYKETVYFEGGHIWESLTCNGLYLHLDGSERDGYSISLDTPDNPPGHREWTLRRGRRPA